MRLHSIENLNCNDKNWNYSCVKHKIVPRAEIGSLLLKVAALADDKKK